MLPIPRQTFPRSHRLSGQKQFAAVFEAKTKASKGPLTVYAKPNGRRHNRLGLSVSRRNGAAVQRNRIKRLLREAYRLTRHELPTGYDLLIVPRGEIDSLEDCRQCLISAMEKLQQALSSRP